MVVVGEMVGLEIAAAGFFGTAANIAANKMSLVTFVMAAVAETERVVIWGGEVGGVDATNERALGDSERFSADTAGEGGFALAASIAAKMFALVARSMLVVVELWLLLNWFDIWLLQLDLQKSYVGKRKRAGGTREKGA